MKTRKTRTKKNTKQASSLDHFNAFLASADRVALELMIREGVMTDPRIDRNFYYTSLEQLAKAFCEPYEQIEVESACSYAELDSKIDAAHMIGLALGLRLRGADLTVSAR